LIGVYHLLGNIYDRLGVSNRTAAVIRAFPNQVA
jgi:DNA-binding CsgD family transcriptional regulator